MDVLCPDLDDNNCHLVVPVGAILADKRPCFLSLFWYLVKNQIAGPLAAPLSRPSSVTIIFNAPWGRILVNVFLRSRRDYPGPTSYHCSIHKTKQNHQITPRQIINGGVRPIISNYSYPETDWIVFIFSIYWR